MLYGRYNGFGCRGIIIKQKSAAFNEIAFSAAAFPSAPFTYGAFVIKKSAEIPDTILAHRHAEQGYITADKAFFGYYEFSQSQCHIYHHIQFTL